MNRSACAWITGSLAAFVAAAAAPLSASGASVVATFDFDHSLSAQQAGVSALSAIDPTTANSFISSTVFGASRTVYRFTGTTNPFLQGGLTFDTTGLVSGNNYSVEMVFCFDAQDSWHRIIDPSGRSADNGFYVAPDNTLSIFPILSGGPSIFTSAAYHYVVLTNSGGDITTYLDGVEQFSTHATTMNLGSPSNLLTFFLDDLPADPMNINVKNKEWSSGNVALIRISSGALSSADVQAQNADPFVDPGTSPGGGSAVPLPSAAGMGLALFLMMGGRRRAR